MLILYYHLKCECDTGFFYAALAKYILRVCLLSFRSVKGSCVFIFNVKMVFNVIVINGKIVSLYFYC